MLILCYRHCTLFIALQLPLPLSFSPLNFSFIYLLSVLYASVLRSSAIRWFWWIFGKSPGLQALSVSESLISIPEYSLKGMKEKRHEKNKFYNLYAPFSAEALLWTLLGAQDAPQPPIWLGRSRCSLSYPNLHSSRFVLGAFGSSSWAAEPPAMHCHLNHCLYSLYVKLESSVIKWAQVVKAIKLINRTLSLTSYTSRIARRSTAEKSTSKSHTYVIHSEIIYAWLSGGYNYDVLVLP